MQHFVPLAPKSFSKQDEASLRDTLKWCSAETREAASAFRRTGSVEYVPAIVQGLIEHYIEREARAKLSGDDDNLRLVEDLGVDSLTMMEIVFLAEDVLQVSIENEDLRPFRTVGDIKRYLASRMGGGAPGDPAFAAGCKG
jgi:3-hydroxyacyl-[acyl-carrier-protein] dehydratase